MQCNHAVSVRAGVSAVDANDIWKSPTMELAGFGARFSWYEKESLVCCASGGTTSFKMDILLASWYI